MRMTKPDDTGKTETRDGECGMPTVDHDIEVWYRKSNAPADPDHEPVAERREGNDQHCGARLMLPIALWQGHAHNISRLHLP